LIWLSSALLLPILSLLLTHCKELQLRFQPQQLVFPLHLLNRKALAYVIEFLTFHKLKHSVLCPSTEVNAAIDRLENEADSSLIAQNVQEQSGDDAD
jgi:hypothetical protein